MEKYRGAFNKNKLLVTYLVLEKHIFDKNIYRVCSIFLKENLKKVVLCSKQENGGQRLTF